MTTPKNLSKIMTLFLQHTPAYTRATLQKNIQLSMLQNNKQQHLQPMLDYLNALNKHKQYLQFFEIGIVRDEKKKIENVAKYVGLAIREGLDVENDRKLEQMRKERSSSLGDKIVKEQIKGKNGKKQEERILQNQIVKNWINASSSNNEIRK